MPLLAERNAMLRTWANQGNVEAQKIVDGTTTGRAGLISLGSPLAKVATAVHAAFYGDAATNPVTGTFTGPDVARNLSITAGATWDGGTVTLAGTDINGTALSEVITPSAGSAVYGLLLFKTVTGATKSVVGTGTHATNTASIGVGDKLALPVKLLNTVGFGVVAGVTEVVTLDSTLNGITFTTVPDGSKVLTVLCNY